MFSFGSQTRITSNKHVINRKLKSYTLREPTGRDYHHAIRQNTVPVDGSDYIYVTLQSNFASLNYEPSKRNRECERKIQNS